MISLAVIGIVVGTALGLRLRVYVLIPAIGFVLWAVAALSIARESGAWWFALAAAVVITAIQLGYLLGGAISLAVARVRRNYSHNFAENFTSRDTGTEIYRPK